MLRFRLICAVAVAVACGGACKRPTSESSEKGTGAGNANINSAAQARGPGTPVSAPPADLSRALELEKVAGGFSRPVGLEVAPGDASGRLFVVEQIGRIRLLEHGTIVSTPFLDMQKRVSRGNEQGLLGLAFHPKFAENGLLYIDFTDKNGTTRVLEYRTDPAGPERADPSSAREIYSIRQPFSNHNAGQLEFGPDGKLYVGLGDGGAGGDPMGAAQDDRNALGKMLRFDVSQTKPEPEIVQKGLRNPWRYHFDHKTGDLYIADVGQDKWEEVDVVAADDLAGHNFGWNITEGTHCFRPRTGCSKTGLTMPVVEYSHDDGCSITGGEVYRGKAIPELDGIYFYADYCPPFMIRSFRWSKRGGMTDHWDWRPSLNPGERVKDISTFGSDADGELYVVSLGGDIYKLVRK